MELELRVNGVVESLDVAPGEVLLTMLRRNGYCSVKQGCETGECGACTVLVDGTSRPSCIMLAAQAGGCTLTTVEGLGSARNLHPLQQAFVDEGAVQCGFCTPGMLLSSSALLERNPNPTEDEVRDALSGNLCRCTGYAKPVQAVLRAAAVLRGETVAPLEYAVANGSEGRDSGTTGGMRAIGANGVSSTTAKQRAVTASTTPTQAQIVGKSVHNVDAVKLTTGRAAFADDVAIHGMIYGRILTSPYAHAVIRSIDVSEAKALPGVHAVLTYEDVQRVPYASGGMSGPQDRYSLDYIVRYVGDRVAAVAAETSELAEQAIKLIKVEYDVLPAILDPRQALEANAPRLHPESESRNIYDAERNIAARVHSDTGDVERGFTESDVIVEGEYLVPITQQAPIENHTVITYFDENEFLVVRTSTQAPHLVRRTLAPILGLPARRIHVEQPNVGSGPGVKQGVVLEDICALLTLASNRPVRLAHSRADEFRSSVQQQHIVRMKTGVKRDGTLIANQMVILASTGAYGTHPLTTTSSATPSALPLYPCPHTRFVAEVLYTNLPPSSTFFGSSPEFFALECHMDEIARRLGIDVIELRRKNWIKAGDTYPFMQAAGRNNGAVIESSGLPECVEAVEAVLQWNEKRGKSGRDRFRRGVGIALSLYGNPVGDTDISGATIKLNEDGSFDVFVGVADDTSKTLLTQIAAEVLNVPMEDILLHTSGTDTIPFNTVTSAADTLYSAGGAVKKAAEQVRRQLLTSAGRMLSMLPEALKIHDGVITTSSLNDQRLTIGQMASHLLAGEGRHIIATASWKERQIPTSFAAQGVEVEVDTDTGIVRVLKIVTAVDAGQLINPLIAESQVQGNVAYALGAGVSEELLYDQKGQLLSTNLSDYRIYNAPDMPEMQTYLIETKNASGPFGAKSVSEVSLSGVAPAIANAVVDALRVRIQQLPMTPERVLRAIHTQQGVQQ